MHRVILKFNNVGKARRESFATNNPRTRIAAVAAEVTRLKLKGLKSRGFRAIIDTKGTLAEYFLYRDLDDLQKKKVISDLVWFDADGKPDFTFTFHGKPVRLACKNVRSADPKRKVDSFRAELQKTRNSKDGTPTRAYRVDQFDILSVALFNRTGKWSYLHISVRNLVCRRGLPELLEIMQTVPEVEPFGHWRQSLVDALLDNERQSKNM